MEIFLFKCNKFESMDITNAMLHVSVGHGKLHELVGAFLKKRISAKNIVLNIDSEIRLYILKNFSNFFLPQLKTLIVMKLRLYSFKFILGVKFAE